ncbi:MAG TPA: hypothetical protein VMV36_05930 [Ignavibacteriaceae bacterium]|nr:hypothetical protein [Ignavibacteriaceae bacterium]
MNYGNVCAKRILVADKMGLSPEFVNLAKLFTDGKLHPMQFLNLEKAGNNAVEKIIESGRIDEAYKIAECL